MEDDISPADAFLWGVATSAYQSEGGYNGAGEPRTNWARAEEEGEVAHCGNAAEFWTRHREDFARCRAMGLNAFRLGIEWSRVQPTLAKQAAEPPPIDFAALDHYAEMLRACREHGLEPIVTLHHFVHPAWLGSDPWLDEKTPALFEKYVVETVGYLSAKLAQPLRFFITVNEPTMFALNTYLVRQFPTAQRGRLRPIPRAVNGLLIAHIRAYHALHALYAARGWPAPVVTLNNYCSDLYWGDKFLLDLLSLAERGVPREQAGAFICGKLQAFEKAFREARLPLRRDIPFYFGSLVKQGVNWLCARRFDPEHFAPLLDAIYASPRARLLDCLALDYYDPFVEHIFRRPVLGDHELKTKSIHAAMMNAVTSKWWDWRVLPSGLHFFCKYYSEDFGGRPVLIAENGMALRRRENNDHLHRPDKLNRSEFLRLHVAEVARLLADGVPLIGYLHWSLFDNYEWGSYTPRFGLFAIDYTQCADRLVEDHVGDRPSETYAALIRAARENRPPP